MTEPDWSRICNEAHWTSAEELARLEEQLEANPADVVLHVKAVGAYGRSFEQDAIARRADHLCWLAEYRPDIDLSGYTLIPAENFPADYARVRERWQNAVKTHDDDLRVLRAAASFFSFQEPDVALPLFERGAEREPSAQRWRAQIAHAHRKLARQASTEDERRAHLAREAVALEEAFEREDSPSGRSVLTKDIGWNAVQRGDFALAKAKGEELLATSESVRGTWQYGNAIHHGHQLLGHVALAGGDIDGAVAELLLSGDTPGSPQLDSFGPELELASALLRSGRRDDVIAFLEKCLRFWKNSRAEREGWVDALRAGDVPERLR